MTDCRLILDTAAEGGWNMAVDEVFLECANSGQTVLRFYGWAEATLSLGYFQSAADRQDHPSSQQCPLVRRASGGGAIVHHHELTYSFATPASAAWARDQQRLYQGFHQTLIQILNGHGMTAEGCRPTGQEDSPRQPFLCFQRRTAGDVLIESHKIAGSAQRRYRSALLQHGSVLFNQSPCAPELPGIAQLSPHPISPTELIHEWSRAIAQLWSLKLIRSPLHERECERARVLCSTKYSARNWTYRR